MISNSLQPGWGQAVKASTLAKQAVIWQQEHKRLLKSPGLLHLCEGKAKKKGELWQGAADHKNQQHLYQLELATLSANSNLLAILAILTCRQYCIKIYILMHLGTWMLTILATSPTLNIPVLENSQFLLKSTLNGKMFLEVVYLLDLETWGGGRKGRREKRRVVKDQIH